MDIIGQNGNDGVHYEQETQPKQKLKYKDIVKKNNIS